MHDWELEEVEVFFGRLYEYSITVGTEGIMVWLVTKNGSFSIKFFCSSLAVRRTKTFLTHSCYQESAFLHMKQHGARF